MSFSDLYDSCFRDLPLLLFTGEKSTTTEDVTSSLTTLDHVMSSSQFVVFFVGSGNRAADLATGLQDLVKKRNERDAVAITNGKERSNSSPARLRRFFGLGGKKKKNKSGSSPSPEVVSAGTAVVRLDTGEGDVPGTDGWFALATLNDDTRNRSRLLRSLGVDTNPAILVIECATRCIVTADGRRLLAEDPAGNDFPWRAPSLSAVLPTVGFSRWNGGRVETCNVEKTTVRAILFGAFWCPPCREWVKTLSPIYASLKERKLSFEIIFASSDRTKEAYDQFVSQMPWPAFPYDPSATIALTRIFRVNGIPSLIVVDEDYEVMSRYGRSLLLEDPHGAHFPWGPRAVYELTEHSVSKLRQEPSLILFTEGSPDDVRFSVSVLEDIGERLLKERIQRDERGRRIRGIERDDSRKEREERADSTPCTLSTSASIEECSSTESEATVSIPVYADPLQVFYTGEDPICDHILDRILGLGDAELPLLVIVDSVVGVYAVCEEEDVSLDVIGSFVSTYKSGKLPWKPLPSPENHRTVAGIPAALIREAAAAKESGTVPAGLVRLSPSAGSIHDQQSDVQKEPLTV